jgi:hypothetical protein
MDIEHHKYPRMFSEVRGSMDVVRRKGEDV